MKFGATTGQISYDAVPERKRVPRRLGRIGYAFGRAVAAIAVATSTPLALAGATAVNSVQDGSWNNRATWDIRVPSIDLEDEARIAHNVVANGVGQSADGIIVGSPAGSGTLTMSSGDLTAFSLSAGTGGNPGTVNLSGGTSLYETLVVGEDGPGTMTISGGTVAGLERIWIGRFTSAGRLTVVGNAASITMVFASDDLRVGANGTLAIAPTANGAAGLSVIDCNSNAVRLDAASTLELDTSLYSPSLNDSWTVITDAVDFTGSFGSLVTPLGFAIQQDITTNGELIIQVTQTPCDGLGGDSDHDGVCDPDDACPGFDDRFDADADGVPDDCEVDCNTNGIPDVLEIAGGSTDDCNTNGVPDTCDIAVVRLADVSDPAPLNSFAATDSAYDDDTQVTTDGAGNWIAVWSSGHDLGGTIGGEGDILYSRSTDNGATWAAAAPLNSGADTDATGEYNPQITTDGNGIWIAVWSSGEVFRGATGFDHDIFYARSADNGATWTVSEALNSNAATDVGYDSDPQLTTDGAGNWIAVWISNDDLERTIGTDTDVMYARSSDNGATWTAVAPLNTDAATDNGHEAIPQLTTDGAGNWIASWSSNDNLGGTIGNDPDILYSRSTDNGATWSAPAPLNSNATTDSGGDFRQELTTDGAGNWIATWSSRDDLGGTIGSDYDIIFARSTDNGVTWSAPAQLNSFAATDDAFDWAPQVTTDRRGNWVAVWGSQYSLSETIGTDGDIFYSQSADNGATWTVSATLNSNAATDFQFDQRPQLTTDGAGHWILVWESADDLAGTIGTDRDILFSSFTVSTTSLDINLNGLPDECEPTCDFDGDFDGDGDVDLSDYLGFAACFGGPAELAVDHCSCFDLDVDGDVDLFDVAQFQEVFTGPN